MAWLSRERALCLERFAALYSGETKTLRYTAERLRRASIDAAQGIKRSDLLDPDVRLPAADRASADYAGSGDDRGHMASAGDMPTDTAKHSRSRLPTWSPKRLSSSRTAGTRSSRRRRSRVHGSVFRSPAIVSRPAQGLRVQPNMEDGLQRRDDRRWAYWMMKAAGRQSLLPIIYGEFERRSGMALLSNAMAK